MKTYQVRVFCANCKGDFIAKVEFGKFVHKTVNCKMCGVAGSLVTTEYLGEPVKTFGREDEK